jgi:hypothetical protein
MYGYDHGQHQQMMMDPYQEQQQQYMDPVQDQQYDYQQQYSSDQPYGGYSHNTNDYPALGSQHQQRSTRRERAGEYQNPNHNSLNRESNAMTIHEISEILNNMAPGADYFQAICEALTRNPNGMPTAATTLMVRNIPQRYTQLEFMQDLVAQGFEKYIDFLYLPTDSRGNQNVGYAFANFVSLEHMNDFQRLMHDDMLRTHRVTTPLVIIPSTTQGWRENVLKVIKNVVLRKQVPNDQLPLLFCKNTGEQFPFPVPSGRGGRAEGGSPQRPSREHAVQGRLREPVTVSLLNEFEDETPGGASRSSSLGRGSENSDRSKCSSWNSQKLLVQKDPLEALAPDASGRDALTPELRKQKEQHYREAAATASSTRFSYENQESWTPQNTQQQKNQFLDASGVRQTLGRYSGVARNHETASSVNSDAGLAEARHNPKLPTNSSDFFRHFGLECKAAPHLKHIEDVRRDERCTLKEKGPPQPRFQQGRNRRHSHNVIGKPFSNQTFYPSGHTPYVQSQKEMAGEEKSPSSKAAAAALRAAIMSSRKKTDSQSTLGSGLSSAAQDFCAMDVEQTFTRKFSDKFKRAERMSSVEEDAESDSSQFKTELFSEHDSTDQNPLWSSASKSMTELLDVMRGGSCERGLNSVPLFARSSTKASGQSQSETLDKPLDRNSTDCASEPPVEEESTKEP